MDHFVYKNNELFCEEIPVLKIVEKIGTPFYLYSANTLKEKYNAFFKSFKSINPLICFSMKTNNNITILKELIKEGSGIDTVSGGEIFLALKAGVAPEKIVYAGIGKTLEEISFAIENNIGVINIESEQELELVAFVAKEKNKKVNAALRVTPDVVDKKTHDKTKTGYKGSKFGVDIEHAKELFVKYATDAHVRLCGIHIHIGSPIYSPEPYVKAIKKIVLLINTLKEQSIQISIIDIGGGFPTDYTEEASPTFEVFAEEIVPLLLPFYESGVKIIIEPGRALIGNAGILVSSINYIKVEGGKKFAILDTGMSHMIRPALYDAEHFIWPIKVGAAHSISDRVLRNSDKSLEVYDIVGPICESSDYLAKDRAMPLLHKGDVLAIFTAGAYGFAMSSQYNAIPRPPEVLIDGSAAKVIRERETYDDLLYKYGEGKILV